MNTLTQLSYWMSKKAGSLHKHATLQITKQIPQYFQTLIHPQGISQTSGSLVSNFVVPETIEERLVEVLNIIIM